MGSIDGVSDDATLKGFSLLSKNVGRYIEGYSEGPIIGYIVGYKEEFCVGCRVGYTKEGI